MSALAGPSASRRYLPVPARPVEAFRARPGQSDHILAAFPAALRASLAAFAAAVLASRVAMIPAILRWACSASRGGHFTAHIAIEIDATGAFDQALQVHDPANVEPHQTPRSR